MRSQSYSGITSLFRYLALCKKNILKKKWWAQYDITSGKGPLEKNLKSELETKIMPGLSLYDLWMVPKNSWSQTKNILVFRIFKTVQRFYKDYFQVLLSDFLLESCSSLATSGFLPRYFNIWNEFFVAHLVKIQKSSHFLTAWPNDEKYKKGTFSKWTQFIFNFQEQKWTLLILLH